MFIFTFDTFQHKLLRQISQLVSSLQITAWFFHSLKYSGH